MLVSLSISVDVDIYVDIRLRMEDVLLIFFENNVSFCENHLSLGSLNSANTKIANSLE